MPKKYYTFEIENFYKFPQLESLTCAGFDVKEVARAPQYRPGCNWDDDADQLWCMYLDLNSPVSVQTVFQFLMHDAQCYAPPSVKVCKNDFKTHRVYKARISYWSHIKTDKPTDTAEDTAEDGLEDTTETVPVTALEADISLWRGSPMLHPPSAAHQTLSSGPIIYDDKVVPYLTTHHSVLSVLTGSPVALTARQITSSLGTNDKMVTSMLYTLEHTGRVARSVGDPVTGSHANSEIGWSAVY